MKSFHTAALALFALLSLNGCMVMHEAMEGMPGMEEGHHGGHHGMHGGEHGDEGEGEHESD